MFRSKIKIHFQQKVCLFVFINTMFYRKREFYANSVFSVMMSRSAALLWVNTFPNAFTWDARHKWIEMSEKLG